MPVGAWGSVCSAHQYVPLFNLLEQVSFIGDRVLDWGCGRGYLSYALVRNGFLVHATDFWNIGMIPDLIEMAPDSYEFTLAEDPVILPFDDSYFDVVTSLGVLEHVREGGGSEIKSLREIHRVLRPGGSLIVAHLPSNNAWPDSFAKRFVPNAHNHEFRYSLDSIRKLILDAGFSMESPIRYGAIPRNPMASLPSAIGNSRTTARTVDLMDAILSRMIGSCSQNLAFVARKGLN